MGVDRNSGNFLIVEPFYWNILLQRQMDILGKDGNIRNIKNRMVFDNNYWEYKDQNGLIRTIGTIGNIKIEVVSLEFRTIGNIQAETEY